MKKLIIILVTILVATISCNKEKRNDNRLDGKWRLVSYTGPDLFGLAGNVTYKFTKSTNHCTIEFDGFISDYDYDVDEKFLYLGEAGSMASGTLQNLETTYTIDKLKRKKMILVDEDGFKMTMEKE